MLEGANVTADNFRLFDDEALDAGSRLMGREMLKQIRRKTSRGQFEPRLSSYPRAGRYNRQYARRKGKSLRPVTMQDTGSMMKSLAWKRIGSGSEMGARVRIMGSRNQRIALYHSVSGAGVNKIRRVFVWLSPQERNTIYRRALTRAIQSQNNRR